MKCIAILLKSLILAGPLLSTPRWLRDAEYLVGLLPENLQETIHEFAGLMPDVRVEVIPGAGHVSMVDKPAEVAAAIRAFLADVESREPLFQRWVALEDDAFTSANASLGDVDGDGDPDILLAKGRHWPLVQMLLTNDGSGAFSKPIALTDVPDRTYTSALVDLDGDGHLDLVVGNDRPDPKRVYRNDGTGRFEAFGTFGDPDWPTRNVTVADLNGDDRPDIVVANRGGPERSANAVCLNDGLGRFPSCTELSRESATTIAAGDLTGDGLPDLLVPHRDGGQSYIHVNDGRGGFAERRAFGPDSSATRAVMLADVNGDEQLDVILGDGSRGGAWVHLRTGDATFAAPTHIGLPSDDVYSMGSADLNGDGHLDLVLGHRGASSAAYLGDGSGTAFSPVRFGDRQGAVYGLAIGDVDGDGRPDVVAARSEARTMLYYNR